MEIITEFNKILKTRRDNGRRITQIDIASKAGISREHVSRILSGKKDASLAIICSIADAIGCKIIIDNGDIATSVDGQHDDTANIDVAALREALRGALDNAKFLQDQITWMRREMDEMRENSLILNTPRRNRQ